MNFHIPFTGSDISTNRIQEHLQDGKGRFQDEAQRLRKNVVEAARQQVIEPAMHAAEKATAMARDAYFETRDTVSKELAMARDLAARQRDTAARWVSANPMTAVCIALAVGALFAFTRKPHPAR